jgi:hypothetical protein
MTLEEKTARAIERKNDRELLATIRARKLKHNAMLAKMTPEEREADTLKLRAELAAMGIRVVSSAASAR